MKIMFFLQSGIIGGAETQLLTLCKELQSRADVTVITSALALDQSFYRKLAQTVNVHQSWNTTALAAAIDFEKPDILQHFHNDKVSMALDRAAHKPKVIEVIHGRIHFPQDVTSTPKHHTDRVVAVSDDAAQFFLGVHPAWEERLTVIPNGIDTSVFFPAKLKKSEGAVKILHVGRLCEGDKKYTQIMDACARLSSHWTLQLVGDGVDRDAVFNHAAACYPGKVQFFNFRENTADIYRQADIYVSRSESEGFGLSIAEAAASGLPVVMWDCGGIARYFKHEETAYIAKNTKEFNQLLQEAVSNRPGRLQIGKAASELIETQLSASVMADSYMALYNQVLSEKKSPVQITKPKPVPVLHSKVNIVGISNPNFTGVTRAVKGWVGAQQWTGIKPHPTYEDIQNVCVQLNKPNSVLIIGGDSEYIPLAREVRKYCPDAKIMMTWHSSIAFNEFAPKDGERLCEWVDLLKRREIDRLAFVRAGTEQVFKDSRIIHFPNAVPARMKVHEKIDLGPGFHIGIFGTGYSWKNMQQSVLAASLLKDAVIHVNGVVPSALFKHAGVRLVRHEHLQNTKFLALLGSMDLNYQGSFTESFGFVFCESWRLGVPCVGSPVFNQLLSQLNEDDRRFCIVKDPDNLVEVAHTLGNIKGFDRLIGAVNKNFDVIDTQNERIRDRVIKEIWSHS